MNAKKIVFLFMGMILFAFITVATVNANKAVINTNNLNVRTGPGTDFEKIGQVHTDEIYPIIQQQNQWVKIQMKNTKGWVTSEYITITDSTDQTMTNNQGNNGTTSITIQHNNTHFRAGPSTTYDIIGYADAGTEFTILAENDQWYKITREDVTGYVFKKFIKQENESFSTSLQNKTIVIDAGHGGRDVGAIGASGTHEKDFTLKTTLELKQELTILGANVILTRKNDKFVSLASRASLSNMVDTDAFISVHYNSVPSLPNVTGIGTYYYSEQNKSLARFIQRGVTRETGAESRGISFADFQVLRQNHKPSILIELGFISNSQKERLLQTNAYQKQIVTGIVNGLNKYFANK